MFRTYILAIIVLVVGVYGVYRLIVRGSVPSTLPPTQEEIAGLADCLTESGAKFYGAYWCSHCERQKEEFGEAASRLPFVECGVEGDVSLQTDVCRDAGITSYPTWVFADGTQKVGEVDFEQLAKLSECPWQE
ncbi:hypothetical protein A2480_01500 [Candidatus Uhrbacteria bacterium RIFOXYC2_FULL_47_19]|uniref:Thioredoxin domain-containing protein n=1 Tax=Candidatus Uhrbacteria bacterium RIFOXYC2_FULL_47_19 TaxID=1802424 RepID=A0A1F7WE47_9BACT|nr:MAG: hypothetical protein A2480_01500 [Candidatus Uhrbacteria bacterium RIFOXYC2_FULL_47_19]